jgi:hypothetical protein
MGGASRAFANLSFLLAALAAVRCAEAADAPSVVWPNETKTATIGGAMLSVHISSRVAGAIDGLVWRGHQFVNDEDHGREIQAAAAFSNGRRECFNPTEGGSAADGTGVSSSSRLDALVVGPSSLKTETRMAFWLSPLDAKTCDGASTIPQYGPLSPDTFRKTVTIGAFGMPNVIWYQSSFAIPEARILGGFEAPTGYMPSGFSEFWIYDPIRDHLQAVSGEIKGERNPIIFATPDRRFALGVYAPPQAGFYGYGGTRFTGAKMASPTVKWNVFFTVNTVAAGEHKFNSYMAVGSLDEVRVSLRRLAQAAGGSH